MTSLTNCFASSETPKTSHRSGPSGSVWLIAFAAALVPWAAEASVVQSQPQAEAAPETPTAAEVDDGPWRLRDALSLPSWVEFEGQHRIRYESMNGRFRSGRTGSDQGLFFRTLAKLTLKGDVTQATLEIMDSRQEFADSGTALSTSQINAGEVLQAFGALNLTDVITDDDKLFVQAGRFTMNVGKRRLVARNSFRNTINTFAGIRGIWEHDSGSKVTAFAVLPTQRLPRDSESLRNNDVVFDNEDFEVSLLGLSVLFAEALGPLDVESAVFVLNEDDTPGRATRNRELTTLDLRLSIDPSEGAFDIRSESSVQFGTSRSSSSATNTTDLDHLAYAQYVEAGYTFSGRQKVRVAAMFDYASGDNSPTDNENNRFDSLFGSRAFDFTPTGIFGVVAQRNIITPGFKITAKPFEDWHILFAQRFFWLDEPTDALTTAGLSDPSGSSGRFIGSMPIARVRWDVVPGSVRLEAGGAYLFSGRFIDTAPGATGEGDVAFGYLASTFSF